MSKIPNVGRLLGLDLGEKRIGVAVCDSDRILATPHSTVKRRGDEKIEHQDIAELADSIGAVGLVIGLPLGLNGLANQAADQVQKEAIRISKRVGLPFDLSDERFTTHVAQSMFHETGQESKKTRDRIDAAAAAVILQSYIG